MPTSSTTKTEPEEDPNKLDVSAPHSFADGDEPPSNAVKKSLSGQAIQMAMGFDCNNQHGNPGDWAVCINGKWYVMTEV